MPGASNDIGGRLFDEAVVEPLMMPLGVVVGDVRRDRAPKMSFAKRYDAA